MSNPIVIKKKDYYARVVGTSQARDHRVLIALRTRKGAWRGLTLDLKNQTRTWAPRGEVRSSSTAKRWVDNAVIFDDSKVLE